MSPSHPDRVRQNYCDHTYQTHPNGITACTKCGAVANTSKQAKP